MESYRLSSRMKNSRCRRFLVAVVFVAILTLVQTQQVQQQPKKKPEPPKPRKADGDPQPPVDDLDVLERAATGSDRALLAPFDTDIRKDCRSILIHCQSEIFAHVYLQCPAMCTKYLEQEGMKGTADHNPEALWEVGTLRTYQGKRIDSDRFEGYVTVISILPLLPGMAFYFYEMMETLHSQFAPKVEFVILPIDLGEGLHIKTREDPKVVILEEEGAIETHPWVKHLLSVKPRSGAASRNHRDEVVQVDLPTDRLTVYIVSSDGYFVERLTVPTMAVLQRKISVYLKTIGYDDL